MLLQAEGWTLLAAAAHFGWYALRAGAAGVGGLAPGLLVFFGLAQARTRTFPLPPQNVPSLTL